MGLWSWIKSLFGKKDAERPMVSLVLLLNEPRYLDADMLTQIVNRTFDVDLGAGGDEAVEFIIGEAPVFILQLRQGTFNVLSFPKPYFDDVQAAAKGVKELRLRKVIQEHQAWLSVDLLGQVGETEEDPYRVIGKLLAALAPEDTLALLWPTGQQLRVWDAQVEEGLRQDKPLGVFESMSMVPVVEV
jgi:hypothetical protein